MFKKVSEHLCLEKETMTIQQHASFDSSAAELNATSKLTKAWESKNAKNAAKAGGISLMALSLAACGGSDSTTTAGVADPVTPVTPATPVAAEFDLTPLADTASKSIALNGSIPNDFRFTVGNDVVNGMTATMASTDTLLDNSTTDNDVLNLTLTTASGQDAITTINIETVNVNMAAASASLDAAAMTGVKNVNVTGTVDGALDDVSAGATIKLDGYTRELTILDTNYSGATATGNADSLNVEVSGTTYGSTAATQSKVVLTAGSASVLETLNVTASGAAANVYNLDASTNVSLSTVNFLGSADATAYVAAADVTGLTLKGDDATGSVTLRIDTDSTSSAVNAANFSGIDNILMADSTVGSDNASISSLTSGQKVTLGDDFGGENSVFTVQGATYTAPAASLTIVLDNETASDAIDAQQIDVQNISALNIESLGNVSSATTVFNLVDDLVGDASTITITGDTSLNLDANIDGKQTASGTDAARAVAVNAEGLTGTAFLDFLGADNAKVSYTVTGTANADTIEVNDSGSSITAGAGNDTITAGNGADTINAGAGTDHIDVSYGADSITGGAGVDTYDIDVEAAAAVAHSVTVNVETVATITVTTADALIAVIDGTTYRTEAGGTALDTNLIDVFIAAHGTTILSAHGVTVTDTDTALNHSMTFAGKTDGTNFALDLSFEDDATLDALTEVVTTGVGALDVDTTITDFAAGDVIDVVGLSLTADGGYYEGAAGSFAVATEYQVIVLTGASYTSSTTAADAIDARYTGSDTDSQVFVYLDSTKGHAVMTHDSNIHVDGAATLNDIVEFNSITSLTDLGTIMSTDSFVVA
ncbi:hypothetical protein N9R31_00420 [bacterium]|nr:hypothetical protein [bacterium]